MLWIHLLSAGVLLEDLEASFGVLSVLDEDSCWLTFFLIEIKGRRSPPKQETWSFVVITTPILNLIAMHPSEAREVFFLILKATVFAHLGYFRFIDVPFRVILGMIFESQLPCVARRSDFAAEWVVTLEIPFSFHHGGIRQESLFCLFVLVL